MKPDYRGIEGKKFIASVHVWHSVGGRGIFSNGNDGSAKKMPDNLLERQVIGQASETSEFDTPAEPANNLTDQASSVKNIKVTTN